MFLTRSLSALATAALPRRTAAGKANAVRVRVEWQEFRHGNHYAPFVAALDKMRTNTNAQDPASLNYWAALHANHCPHGIAYFMAWHRGLLYLFEQSLQRIAGTPDLMLPYWDYYKSSGIPAEFTAPAAGNPLYRERLTTDLYPALSLNPFRDTLINFPRGMPNAFEPQMEYKPHGPIHNLIGKLMATPQAPADPIFWVHHAQVDRLWCAWAAAGGHRQMPASTDPYWQGHLTYGAALTVPLQRVIDPRMSLGYRYADETLPTSLPPAQLAYAAHRDVGDAAAPARATPPGFTPSPRLLRAGHDVPAGAVIACLRQLVLHGDRLRIALPVSMRDWQRLRLLAQRKRTPPFGPSARRSLEAPFHSVRVVLDQVDLLGQAAEGGYFYDIYLTLPGDSGPPCPLGGFGPFEISGNRHHHGHVARLSFAATDPMLAMAAQAPRQIMLSFVRIDGPHAPRGPAIRIAELRLEFSVEETD